MLYARRFARTVNYNIYNDNDDDDDRAACDKQITRLTVRTVDNNYNVCDNDHDRVVVVALHRQSRFVVRHRLE